MVARPAPRGSAATLGRPGSVSSERFGNGTCYADVIMARPVEWGPGTRREPAHRPLEPLAVKQRTLIADRLYYGLDAAHVRAASARALTRVVGLPPERARVSASNLWQDFAVEPHKGAALVETLVAGGMLEPPADGQSGYGFTSDFIALAQARVVEPLPRTRARAIVGQAKALVERFNEDAVHNPLSIAALAVFGDYMTRHDHLAEVSFGVVVNLRAPTWRTRLGRMQRKAEGAESLRAMFRELSTFTRVRVVTELAALPRPFSVVLDARG